MEISSQEANGSIYKAYKFSIGKTVWVVLKVTGIHNYITVKKKTANPFGLLGTQFDNFNDATRHYKSAEMKIKLLLIETIL